ncbi:MAG: dephospho-CoA kinase [Desulfobacterales bacterium]|nr:dephospho-CoA kinase [Desulfobacterales bacterium]
MRLRNHYSGFEKMAKTIKGKDNRLLLGVTGGIASGKSTVAHMLKEMGAPIIDFDLIARQVVEPGKPAYKQIIEYFGKQVLQEDGSLDRKKLSKIVFRDFEKRKKLESFTHPPIYEEFLKQVNWIAEKDPEAIIQVAIPLLVESNLQYMFHKLLIVYIPEEQQIARLIERDGISKEEAANILKAQLPIDEKVGYADFVIHNEGSVEETKKQVEHVWQTLKKLQKK